jgi:hypothetical protein
MKKQLKKQLKQVLALLLCVPVLMMPLYTLVPGATANVAVAAETLAFPATQDAFVSNFNNQGGSVGITLNANKLIYGKFRHAYLKFDLSSIDTDQYAIDELQMTLNFRKSHGPNELVFTESELTLRDSGDEWTVNNLTYNNRPNDIAGAPVVTRNVTSNGEESLAVDVSEIFRAALDAGRTVVSIHLTTTQVNEDTVGASEMYASRNTAGQPGPSLAVALGDPIVRAEAPGEPQNFTATPGSKQVALNWSAPADDGGAAILKYEVSNDDGATWIDASSGSKHIFSGLTNGTAYTFKVRAVNSVGGGAEATVAATPQVQVVSFAATDEGSAYVDKSAPGSVRKTASTTDNNIQFKIMAGKGRHGYLRFDLSAFDASLYNIDDMTMELAFRKSHDPNTLIFVESESVLSTDSAVKWTSNNLTYNNRPNDIAGSPAAQITFASSGEGSIPAGQPNAWVDVTEIFQNALKAGRKEVSLHLYTDSSDNTAAGSVTQLYIDRPHPSGQIPVTVNVTLGDPVVPLAPEGFATRVEAEAFYKSAGNIYIRDNGAAVPGSAAGEEVVLTGASNGRFVDFSDPVANFKTGSGSNSNTIPAGQDQASWKVVVPAAGVYELAFKYNNPATKTDGYRNVRDERNTRIVINDDEPDFTNTMDPHWAGWMIFNISGYNEGFNPATNTSLTPQTDNAFAHVKGNTAWNNNYMNVWLEKGENTITLGMEAPPGQGVYDGPNLDYFDVTYIGDQMVGEDEIPYLDEDFVFQHPGISFTLEDLDHIKANKGDTNTVYGKGYQELTSAVTWFDSNTVNPAPVLDVGPYNSPNIGGTEYTRGGSKALYYALRYYLDGDAAYGKKAIEVLNGWAGTLKTLGAGNDLKLRIAIVGPDFVNAAEIIRHLYNNDPGVAPTDRWQDADIAEFETFLRMLLDRTYDFYPQANGNWDAIIGGFNMTAAVYLEDIDLFNDALKQRYLGTYRAGNAVSMGSLPSYIYPGGEQQESSRDQPHARMGITGLATQADIAWNQGVDIYGAYDNRLLAGAVYNARYAVGEEVESATFISDRNRTQSGIWAVGYELVGNHYLNEAAGAAAAGQLDVIYEAADLRLRTGSVNNEAGRKANYYGAMLFTDKRYDVAMSLSASKNALSSAGDELVLTANVQTDSAIKRVNWSIPDELKPFIDYELTSDTTLKLTLKELPEVSRIAGAIKATSVKKATVSDTVSISIVNDGIDKTDLNALIAEAEQLVEAEYTAASWAVLANALRNAKELSGGNTTQAAVDQALATLQTALGSLAEAPAQIAGPDMGNYLNNGKTAAMIIRMKNGDGQYVKVDPITEKLSLTANAAEASAFALYVHDYFATVDHQEPEVGATRTAYSIKALDNNKYLTIQNYFTAEQFLSNTHRYYNILSGASSGTATNRTFEIKASADMPNWNERFYVDHYAKSGYYRLWSHLSTMRDDSNFNRFNVKMTADSMQSTGTAAQNTESRFYFEEVTGRDLLEVSQAVSGDAAELFWRPVNGDANPAHYAVVGTSAAVAFADGLLRATVSDLSVGTHSFTVQYNGDGYDTAADVQVRIFSHPGILQTMEDLDRMKLRVQEKAEPWYSDYQRLLNSVPYHLSDLDYETKVFANVGRGGAPSDSANIGYFEKAGNAAYFSALQWVITGDDRYAAHAADILSQWANVLKVIDGRDRILGAGINAYKYASAAEIIRHYNGGYSGYSDADFQALQDMMINVVYPVIQDAGVPMVANGNWDAAAIVSMMAIGVLADNADIFDRTMALYQDIHVNGSIFAYVHESGQIMETGRDQAHALLAIGYMAEINLIAYHQDEDLYSLYDNRLAKAFEYAAKYNLYSKELYDEDVPFAAMPNVFGDTSRGYYGVGFDMDNNGLNRGEIRPVFEQALALNAKAGGAALEWTARAAAAARPQGMVHFDNLNFGTLTYYNGEPLNASEPYFQIRTRWEPLYQRNWSIVDGVRTAETLNSYYDVNASGELVTSVMKKDAPFYQLVANDDGTYSIRLVKSNTYLSVKDDTAGDYNVIKADAATIGDNEKFLLQSSGVGPFFLVSPKYDNRIVYQHAAGSGSGAVLTLRLGAKKLSDIADIPDITTNERLIFMYNAEEIALSGTAAPHITSASSVSVAEGEGGTFQVNATGMPAVSYSLNGAPAGVTINSATGLLTIADTTAAGVHTFIIAASNGITPDATQEFTLTVTESESVFVPDAPQNLIATPGDGQVTLSWSAPGSNGGAAIIKYEVSLDNGISWIDAESSASHIISGLSNGTEYTFQVRAVNSAGSGAAAEVGATPVAEPSGGIAPGITTTALPEGKVGAAYSQQLAASGDATIIWSIAASELPNGLSLSEEGVISGTLTRAGTFTFTVKAENDAGSDTRELSMLVSFVAIPSSPVVKPVIAGPTSMTLTEGYALTSTATYSVTGTEPIAVQKSAGSEKITWDNATRKLVIVPGLAAGTYTAELTAQNSVGTEKLLFTLTVQKGDKPTVSLNGDIGTLTRNEDGSHSLVITDQQLSEALGDNDELIVIAKDIHDLTLELSIAAMGTAALTIETGFGTVTLSNAALQSIKAKYGDALALNVRKGSYIIELLHNGKPVAYDEPGNPLTVTLPVEVAEGRDVYEYVVIKKENGRDIIMPLAVSGADSVRFAASATGTYDVVYNGRSFDDVSPTGWAARDIAFAAARALFAGTSDSLFSPASTMTRAMFAQVLANLEGIDRSANTKSVFTDVPEGVWYAAAVAWAADNGIISGTGQGKFSPNDSITREQMAVILYNYAAYKGYELPATAAAEFADRDNVSSWAKEAVDAIAAAGILIGKPDGSFVPQDHATRAEVAAVFARFIRALNADNS